MATSYSIFPSSDAAIDEASVLSARGILAVLSVVFLGLALARIAGGRSAMDPAIRTWLIVGAIFGIVSTWLWFRGP